MTKLDLNKLADDVVRRSGPKYYDQPIPSKIDNELLVILQNKWQNAKVCYCLTGRACSFLKLFAQRIASLCVRNHDEEMLGIGIFAIAQSLSALEDFRDAIVALGLLYNSAIKLNVNPEDSFKKVWQVVPESEEFLRKFLSRDADNKSLEAMLYKESSDENGFLYVSTW